MRRYTTAAKVGVFALLTLLAGLFIYRFISKRAGPGRGYVVYALLDDATGIAKLSYVRVAGIPVGSVESIRLEQGKARVDMRIHSDVPLFDDAAVAKISSSLLGEYFLSIAPGTEGKRQLEDGDRIRYVIEAATTDAILRDVSSIAKDIKKVSEALAASVGTEEGKENL